MLSKFTVSNYKNFDKKTCLDLTDVRKYDFNTGCVKDGVLNKAIILGRNGSGKTNLGLALFDISYTLTENMSNPLQTQESSFLNGNSTEKYATFIYEFMNNGETITFEYRKTSPRNIVYESLTVGRRVIFKRDGLNNVTSYSGLKRYKLGTLNINVTDGPLSVLRFICNNTVPDRDSPMTYVMDFVSHMLYFRSVQDGNQYIGLMNTSDKLDSYLMSNDLIDEFEEFLRVNAELDVDLQKKQIPGMPDVLVQKFDNRIIPFSEISSSGTKAALLFFYWSKQFDNVSFLYMDEFDAYYHSEMSERILKSVIRRHEFQSILTTHNTDLVDNNLMRPDCYLVMTRNGVKSFPELTEREIREGHNLRKLLRGGEFE